MSSDPGPPVPAHTPSAPVAGDAKSPAIEPYEPAPPTFGKGKRATFAFVAVMCFVVAAILFSANLVSALAMVVFGGTMAYFAATGARPADAWRAPASARFHELADPTRPLTPDDVALPADDRPRALPDRQE